MYKKTFLERTELIRGHNITRGLIKSQTSAQRYYHQEIELLKSERELISIQFLWEDMAFDQTIEQCTGGYYVRDNACESLQWPRFTSG